MSIFCFKEKYGTDVRIIFFLDEIQTKNISLKAVVTF